MLWYMSQPQEGTAEKGLTSPPQRDDHDRRQAIRSGTVPGVPTGSVSGQPAQMASRSLVTRRYVDLRRQASDVCQPG